MKLGIIGLSGAGKATVFEALTKQTLGASKKGDNRIAIIRVPDKRIDILSEKYKPKKTIYAQVGYFLPDLKNRSKETSCVEDVWAKVRDCDALIHVIRNFSGFGIEKPAPYIDFLNTDQNLILADLFVVEKRIQKLKQDRQRNKKNNPAELPLLQECLKNLENEIPLRKSTELSSAHLLKGYAFLTAKPMLLLFNNEDENEAVPDVKNLTDKEECMIIRGKLEQELVQMSEKDAADFLEEFNITASATDRVIKKSYDMLGLISFFTVGEDEVRAWTIRKGTKAADGAEVIHSDIKKGFIRAEVLSYDDFIDSGSYQESKKKGVVRLEGKTYEIKDGDIINFRFNV